MEKYEAMKIQADLNAKQAEMNRRRHQNVDITFNKLCPLIDEVFDVANANAPGGVSYDCCYESFKEEGNANGKIGQSLMCQQNALLNFIPYFPQSATGHCALTCGDLPAQFAGK